MLVLWLRLSLGLKDTRKRTEKYFLREVFASLPRRTCSWLYTGPARLHVRLRLCRHR